MEVIIIINEIKGYLDKNIFLDIQSNKFSNKISIKNIRFIKHLKLN